MDLISPEVTAEYIRGPGCEGKHIRQVSDLIRRLLLVKDDETKSLIITFEDVCSHVQAEMEKRGFVVRHFAIGSVAFCSHRQGSGEKCEHCHEHTQIEYR